MSSLDDIRADFPILAREVNGRPLVYLDNAASTQKPQVVVDTVSRYYENYNANVHRGVHALSVEATEAMEATRRTVHQFINARADKEIIFTSGTTHGINILAQGWGREHLRKGDEILISGMEHHSNIVPWQMACESTGAVLKVIPVTESGELDMEAFVELLSERTKMISIVHVSNTLGTINPIKTIIDAGQHVGALVHIDGAQAIAHMAVDVQDLGCDFYTFSGHKIFGPTGTGVLYGKEQLLEAMPPIFGGGEMIKTVTFEKTTYNTLPFKFEAGTPNIAGIIGLGAAIDYLSGLSWEEIRYHELAILDKALNGLKHLDGIRIIGESENRSGAISFLVGDIHPFDLGTLLDKLGIAVRTGHHCTEPLMDRYGIPGTVRASFTIYNTEKDVEMLLEGLERVVPMLA
ncbi:MAG: cysteine desulfurase [Flavobacteriales bacterium]|nr:cysteine desulfurase [Flavobacteriales bacterium]NNK80945.1 cysteine desulfurase [Flavobacteriales bacterium]